MTATPKEEDGRGIWCGLRRIKHLFLVTVIIVFLSIFYIRNSIGPNGRHLSIRVKESKDTLLSMNQSDRLLLARKYLLPMSRAALGLEEEPPTNSSNSSLTNNSTQIATTEVASTPILMQTVQPSQISTNLSEAFQFLYGDSKPLKPLKYKPPCPAIPRGLVGEIKVFKGYYPMDQLNSLDFRVQAGGSYTPPDCKPSQKLALVIPFRRREKHLSILLLNLHPLLQKQQVAYTIFVVNQIPGSKFNRAMLMNIGFVEAMKEDRYDCVIFHDVDLLPQNDKNLYVCPQDNPRHMSVYIDKFDYLLPYQDILGGIVAISSHLFVRVNGYSNQFFGWGGEDDDFSIRCRRKSLAITRYPKSIARYRMIRHEMDSGNEANPQRFDMLKHTDDRQDIDGLNTITGAYTIKSIVLPPLYTRISIALDQSTVMNSVPRPLPDFLTNL